MIRIILLSWTFVSLSLSLSYSQALQEKLWATDGDVYAIDGKDNQVFVAGLFRNMGPLTGSAVAYQAATDTRITGFPLFNGPVYAISEDGNGGWFVGGDFSMVGDSSVNNLVRLRSDFSIDTSWTVETDGPVYALLLNFRRSHLYVGGDFTQLGSFSRRSLGAVDYITGAVVDNWQFDANGTVYALQFEGFRVAGPGSNRRFQLAVGGDYSSLGGNTNIQNLGSIETGVDINNDRALELFDVNGPVFALKITLLDELAPEGSDNIYFGGSFTSVNGNNNLRNLARFDTDRVLDTSYQPDINGPVYTMETQRNSFALFIGGAFNFYGDLPVNNIAAIDLDDGLIDTGFRGATTDTVFSIFTTEDRIYAGGSFNSANNIPRAQVVAFNRSGDVIDEWGPNLDGSVRVINGNDDLVVMGGVFESAGRLSRRSFAVLDASTGSVTDLDIDLTGGEQIIQDLMVMGDTLFIAGNFREVLGETRRNLAAIRISDFSLLPFNPDVSNIIYALAHTGDTIYIGGNFNRVDAEEREDMAAFRIDTLSQTINLMPFERKFLPGERFVSGVYTIYPYRDKLYVGGGFRFVDEVTDANKVNAFAVLDLATPGFPLDHQGDQNIGFNQSIHNFYGVGDTLFAVGGFDEAWIGVVNEQSNTRVAEKIAAIDISSDTRRVLDWSFLINESGGLEEHIAFDVVQANDDNIYVTGNFTEVNGQAIAGLARFAPLSASPDAFAPQIEGDESGRNFGDLHASGTSLYVGGLFLTANGQNRKGLASYSLTPSPVVQSLDKLVAKVGDTVRITGNFFEGVGRIELNQIPANTFNVINGQEITFILPPGAKTDFAKVFSPTGEASSANLLEVQLQIPANLQVSADSADLLIVTWEDNSTDSTGNEAGYVINRTDVSTNQSQEIQISANTTQYIDNSVLAGTVYYYQIKALSQNSEEFRDSEFSSIVGGVPFTGEIVNATFQTLEQLINIYPNPGTRDMVLDLESLQVPLEEAEWAIFDLQGIEISSQKIKQGFRKVIIPIETLPRGRYFLKLSINRQLIYKGFIKQ